MSTQAVKRACDACHRRKVKCDGVNPCRNCAAAALCCTYNAIPQKKGPKGSRAKVISELRETQRQTSLAARVHNRMNNLPAPVISGFNPSSGLLTPEFVKECLNFYFDHMHPQLPILDRNQMESILPTLEQNRDTYCLVASLCAFVMLQPGMSMPIPANDAYGFEMAGSNIIACQLLIDETIRVRKGQEPGYAESVSLPYVATNYFLFASHYAMDTHDRAWYYLRDGISHMHLADWDKEDGLAGSKNQGQARIDPAEVARRRRLYWLFYIAERAYDFQRHRPVSLQATINAPKLQDDPRDAMQLESFVLLVEAYRPFNYNLISRWKEAQQCLSARNIAGLQAQLSDTINQFKSQGLGHCDIDANVSWLRSVVWQLKSRNAGGNNPNPGFNYPVHMLEDLLNNMAARFPLYEGVQRMTPQLMGQLLETCENMLSVLERQPVSGHRFQVGARDHIEHIVDVLATLRNGNYNFVPLLFNRVTELFWRLADPSLAKAPETAPEIFQMQMEANFDFFDGFGNAGMAQPPPQPQMQMAMDNSQQLALDMSERRSSEDYEVQFKMEPQSSPDSSIRTSPPNMSQASDMNASFAPAAMSPGLDYSQNMSNYAQMSEMVMTPMGNTPNPLGQMHNPQLQNLQSQQQMCQPLDMGHYQRNGMNPQQQQELNMMYQMGQPQPQRQNSFPMQGQQMRTVADFQGLQQRNNSMSIGMPSEMDFNTMG